MSQSVGSEIDWRRAVTVGLGAWLVGVILTFVLGQVGANQFLQLFVQAAPIAASFLFYMLFQTWFVTGSGMGSLTVFTLLPIVILLVVGYYAASTRGGGDAGDGFREGAAVSAGYLIGAILTVVVVIALAGGQSGFNVPLNLDTLINVIVSGVVFPVVFGGIGGAVAAQV